MANNTQLITSSQMKVLRPGVSEGLDSNSKNVLVKVLKGLDQEHTSIWQKKLNY